MTPSLHESTSSTPTAGERSRLWAVACAAVLGLALVYGAGLAPMDIVHNAAHDARHAAGFPCH